MPTSQTRMRRIAGVCVAVNLAAIFWCLQQTSHHPALPLRALIVGLPLVGAAAGLQVLYRTSPRRIAARAWRQARTMSDLCDLTVEWLNGRIPQSPTYLGGPNEETSEILGHLEGLNRAGFLTDTSQPHFEGSVAGHVWRQRDGVTGFCDRPTMLRLRELAEANGLYVRAYRGFARRPSGEDAITVTTRDGKHYTGFGHRMDNGDLDSWREVCSPAAVAVVKRAWQVTLVDSRWDRPGFLWRVLAEFTD